MITIHKFIDNFKSYINSQIDSMSVNTPVMKFIKPVVTRIIDNNTNKIIQVLGIVADNNGEIDAEGILSEMIDTISETGSFTLNIPVIGNIIIGNSNIKMNLPIINKTLVLSMEDLRMLKEVLISK